MIRKISEHVNHFILSSSMLTNESPDEVKV